MGMAVAHFRTGLKFHNAEMSHLLRPNLSSFSQINLQILKLIIISVEYNLNSVK